MENIWIITLAGTGMFVSYVAGFGVGFKRGHKYCFDTLMEELKKKFDEENKEK